MVETTLGGGGGFFGGVAGGVSDAQTQLLAQEKQKQVEKVDARDYAMKQIDATIQHISAVAKAAAAAGNDPQKILAASQPLIQSAQGLAQAAGIDPNMILQRATVAASIPPAEDNTKHSLVKVGGGGLGDPDIVLQHEATTGKITRIDPKTGQPILSQPDVITPGQAQRANPPVASAAPVQPSSAPTAPDGTPVQTVAARFPNDPTAPPTQPTGPTLPPDMQPGPQAIDYAMKNNVVGPAFLPAIPPPLRNTVTGLVDYKVNPDALSKRLDKGSGQSEYTRYLSWAHQLTNGEYDPKWYKPIQKAITEFTSGGQTSPAGQITVGNTALAHGGQVADAIDKLKAVPGLLQKMESSDTPFVSYAASALKNQSLRGTSEGAALQAFLTASHHFVDETTKFYAGGQPAEAGRARGLENFNAAKSEMELYQALNSEAELLSGKVGALQDRWKNAVGGPKALNNVVIRNAIPDFPVLSENSKVSMDRIGQGYIAVKFKNGQQGGGNVQTGAPVDYRTYFGNQ